MGLQNRMPNHGGGEFLNRRQSRPPIHEVKSGKRLRMKQPPPEHTSAESFYYLKQMNAKTPMVFILTDGEEVRGWIEWYDRSCLKVSRSGAPNLLIQKHCIKYLFKEDELT
ncbi:MAG TPA: hypothetical protein VIL97_08630 [Thermoanaerobaculia bacterium]